MLSKILMPVFLLVGFFGFVVCAIVANRVSEEAKANVTGLMIFFIVMILCSLALAMANTIYS